MIWLLLILFAILWWQKRNPYIVTRTEMRSALERTLQNTMTEKEWQKLIYKRIPRDRYLDSLRERLLKLPLQARGADGALYAPEQMTKIAALLDELRTKRA